MDKNNIFTALKKCNNIGKKLGSGTYIIVDGMLISEGVDDENETASSPFAISFLDDKLIKQLDALAYIGLEVDGLKLYEYINNYEFDGFNVSDKYIYAIFNTTYVDDKGFINDFNNILREKGYTEEQIGYHEFMMYSADINVYEEYIKYKKSNKPKEIHTHINLPLKVITEKHELLKKANNIIDELSTRELVGEKELLPEIYSKILESKSPVELDVGDIHLRLMKSLFVTGTTKSKVLIKKIFCSKNTRYLIIEIENSGITTCNIYKILKY